MSMPSLPETFSSTRRRLSKCRFAWPASNIIYSYYSISHKTWTSRLSHSPSGSSEQEYCDAHRNAGQPYPGAHPLTCGRSTPLTSTRGICKALLAGRNLVKAGVTSRREIMRVMYIMRAWAVPILANFQKTPLKLQVKQIRQ